jgi:hypothetical protein
MQGRRGTQTLAGKLARAISAILATAVFLTAAVSAAAAASREAGAGAASSGAIAFADEAGRVLQAPVIALDNAYPGMPVQRSALRLRNNGDLDEAFSVTAEVSETGSRSLADVLVIRVTDEATGESVYQGPLSGLSFERAASLRPGEVASYVAAITWPPTTRDDLYQGAGVSFTLKALARSPEGGRHV